MACFNLKPGESETDQTILYLYWSNSKRRLIAYVAELKPHLAEKIKVSIFIDTIKIMCTEFQFT